MSFNLSEAQLSLQVAQTTAQNTPRRVDKNCGVGSPEGKNPAKSCPNGPSMAEGLRYLAGSVLDATGKYRDRFVGALQAGPGPEGQFVLHLFNSIWFNTVWALALVLSLSRRCAGAFGRAFVSSASRA